MEKIDRRFDPIPHHYGNSRETTAQCIDLAVGAVVRGQGADVSGVGVSAWQLCTSLLLATAGHTARAGLGCQCLVTGAGGGPCPALQPSRCQM